MATLALPAGIETDGAVRLFNKWSYDDVEVKDISLIDYIQVKAPVYLPHTAGRFASKRFRKAQCPIVERLTNSLMMHGRNNGKKLMAVRIVKHAFEIIHLLSDQNPIQVLVDAIINTGPREDSTRIGSAGTVRRQAVDVSPLRRVNQAVSLLTIGVSLQILVVFFWDVRIRAEDAKDDRVIWRVLLKEDIYCHVETLLGRGRILSDPLDSLFKTRCRFFTIPVLFLEHAPQTSFE